MCKEWLVKEIVEALPVVNKTTEIYLHDRLPVGIVKVNRNNYDVCNYALELVDSFTWYSELNQLHIFLKSVK